MVKKEAYANKELKREVGEIKGFDIYPDEDTHIDINQGDTTTHIRFDFYVRGTNKFKNVTYEMEKTNSGNWKFIYK